MSNLLIAVVLVVGVFWILYKYWTSIYFYWKKKGLPYYPPTFPFGSDPNLVFFNEFRGYSIDKMYKRHEANPLFGIFVLRKPMLIAKDPGTIRMILTKEFSHFRDRHPFEMSENDVLNQHLFNLEGEKWRTMRVKLTPTFTTGKIKAMLPFFVFSSSLLSKINSKVDIKELISRYTTDTICNCAFGMETDVINNPDNKLREIGIKGVKLTLITKFKLILNHIIPQIEKYFPLRMFPIEDEKYLVNLVKNIVDYREKNDIKRNDFMNLLIELKNKGTIGEDMKDEIEHPFDMSLELMTAQCFVFFVAGFEPSSSIQSFCLYELALQQDIQSRVAEEIDEKLKKYGGTTYAAVQEMEYLDMVLSETMRKYPTLSTLIRICTKTFTTPGGHIIKSGTNIIIPIWSLHHDPKYFPNPDKFDPERFSQENKYSITPYTYLPFGEGPRMCIGMRFGQLQTKMGIITILRKFKVEPCEETKIPLVLGGTNITTAPKDPIVLKLVAR